MKKTVNECTDKLLVQNSETFTIKKEEKEKEKEKRKKGKNITIYCYIRVLKISQQLSLKILTMDESNDKLSTACQ